MFNTTWYLLNHFKFNKYYILIFHSLLLNKYLIINNIYDKHFNKWVLTYNIYTIIYLQFALFHNLKCLFIN